MQIRYEPDLGHHCLGVADPWPHKSGLIEPNVDH